MQELEGIRANTAPQPEGWGMEREIDAAPFRVRSRPWNRESHDSA